MRPLELDADRDLVHGRMRFWPTDGPSILTHPPIEMDMRKPRRSQRPDAERTATPIRNARASLAAGADLGLETSGFQCFETPTSVSDWFDTRQVIDLYYEECRSFARNLLGAQHAFTWDHLIREPGKQTAGGGTDGSTRVTGSRAGGGYIDAVHMDYSAEITWAAI